MKRFWNDVAVEAAPGGWRVALDGRAIKTAVGSPQIVPSAALAEALADEWRAQGDEIDAGAFVLRDMADFAIDIVAADRDTLIAALLAYAESDTLCYHAEPDEPLAIRQRAVWEPLLAAAEARWNVKFKRVSGIIHRAQPPATLARMREALATQPDFTLAALNTLASLAASLVIALAALEPGAGAATLWDAANLEEDWQFEQWGVDGEALALRTRRAALFVEAMRFANLAEIYAS